MGICEVKSIGFQERSHKFGITSKKLIQHFTVVNVVCSLWQHGGWSVVEQLTLLNWLYYYLLVESLHWSSEHILRHVLI